MSTPDDATIAEALGHSGFALGQLRDGRYYVTCGCGYRSTGRQNVAQAVQTGTHHLRKMVAEFKRSGASLPPLSDRRARVATDGDDDRALSRPR